MSKDSYRISTLKLMDYLILYYIEKIGEISLSSLKESVCQKQFYGEKDLCKKRIDILQKKAHYIRTTIYCKYESDNKAVAKEYYILTGKGKTILAEFSGFLKALPLWQ